MKNLFDLYFVDTTVQDIKTNSKEVGQNDLFACTKGINVDRHNYIDEAIDNGAKFLVVSKGKGYKVPYVKVKNVTKEIINISKYLYNNAKNINLIAVTGTDGKTTTASIIKDMLGQDLCGYIGTNGISGKYIKANSNNTTPSIEVIYKYLNKFYEEGLKYASIEASSEGMLYNRMESLSFKIAILTNFTEDHLNVHKNLNNYLKCKRKVFSKLDKDGTAILNRDDPFYFKFRKSCKAKVITYGKSKKSTLQILNYEENYRMTKITYLYNKKKYYIESPLLGEFNVYNLSAAICALISLGYKFQDIRKKVLNIKNPMGRCEFLDYKTNYKILIDYAHTENGIRSILTYLQSIKKNKIITVVGSAGGREKEKRKGMGKYAQSLSDIVIYTMDDPRYENVLDIINDLKDTSKQNYLIEPNRSIAIKKALDMAKEDDIIAILGKGRDNYMAINDQKIFYSDILVLDDYFKKNNKK